MSPPPSSTLRTLFIKFRRKFFKTKNSYFFGILGLPDPSPLPVFYSFNYKDLVKCERLLFSRGRALFLFVEKLVKYGHSISFPCLAMWGEANSLFWRSQDDLLFLMFLFPKTRWWWSFYSCCCSCFGIWSHPEIFIWIRGPAWWWWFSFSVTIDGNIGSNGADVGDTSGIVTLGRQL